MPERPAAMPGDVRAVLGAVGVEGGAHARRAAGRREGARHDDLAVRRAREALREARRVAVAGARERRPGHVDAVVDDADAHAVAGRGEAAVEPAPERRGADHGRHAVGAAPGPASGRSRRARRACTPATPPRRESSLRGTVHDERVHHGRHAARAPARPGRGAAQPPLGGSLLARDRGQREARCRGAAGRRARAASRSCVERTRARRPAAPSARRRPRRADAAAGATAGAAADASSASATNRSALAASQDQTTPIFASGTLRAD